VRRQDLIQSIKRIYATREQEIDCEQLQALLAAYVQTEMNGVNPAERFPAVQQHLAQCPDCFEEYLALLHVAGLYAQDVLPEAEALLQQFEAEPVPERGAPIAVPHRRKP